MKKIVCLALTLLMLSLSFSALAQGELVSEKAEIASAASSAESVIVQDMYHYMQNQMEFDAISNKADGTSSRKFQGSKDAYELIEAYVNAVCDGEHNLRFVDSHYTSYGDPIFFSFAMEYTGTAPDVGETMEMMWNEASTGHVTIWGSRDHGRVTGYITISSGLSFGDLGLRVSGETQTIALPGESLDQPLYRLEDGSYRTGDGRFTVKPGEAVVCVDGTPYTTQATLVRNQAENREELRILNFCRNQSIVMAVPYNSVMTGDILDRRAIGQNQSHSYDDEQGNIEELLHWKFSTKLLGAIHGDTAQILYLDDLNEIKDASVRVMYWNPQRDEAVFYICITFETAPYTYEAVAAVGLGGTPASTKADEVFAMKAYDTLEISFEGTEFGASTNMYVWEILEGSRLIELTGTRSRTCTVQAWDPGTVRLKVEYRYSVYEPDVLTGISTPEQKSKTREYVINIEP